jgi:hypothetical protein
MPNSCSIRYPDRTGYNMMAAPRRRADVAWCEVERLLSGPRGVCGMTKVF